MSRGWAQASHHPFFCDDGTESVNTGRKQGKRSTLGFSRYYNSNFCLHKKMGNTSKTWLQAGQQLMLVQSSKNWRRVHQR